MNTSPLKIVFHGQNAANFRQGFETLIAPEHQVLDLSDALDQAGEREHYESADVVIGIKLNADMPKPLKARLFHAPAAGTDAVNTALLPPQCTLANCFGHENAIAEYVIAALLMRHVPLARADQDLRQQRWTYWAGRPTALRTELGSQTLGLVDAAAIAAMRPDAVLLNVGRGAVIDEQALYQALQARQIGGAVIDTWYQYPTPTQPECAPSKFDFASLDNVLMTPHMSGWTAGTVRRRQETLAENIGRLSRGEALINVLHGPV